MKLYIKQRVFSWRDSFFVKDESGNDRYCVKGALLSFGKRLRVFAGNDEVVYVEQRLMTLLPKYNVFVGGMQVAEVVREMSLLKPRYSVRGLGWEVRGDFWSHEYEVIMGGVPVARITKAWFVWGDSYELEVLNPRDELPALAVVLAIDCVTAAQAQVANS